MTNKQAKRPAPWAVRGVTAEARNAAMKAAKREGLTLGEWLDNGIRQLVQDRSTDTPAEEISRQLLDGQAEILRRLDSIEAATREQKSGLGGIFGRKS